MATMPSIPQLQPMENPLEQYGRVVALKSMLQEQQLRQIQAQQAQRQMAYEQQLHPLQLQAEQQNIQSAQQQYEMGQLQYQLAQQKIKDANLINSYWASPDIRGDIPKTIDKTLQSNDVSPLGKMEAMSQLLTLQKQTNEQGEAEAKAAAATHELFDPLLWNLKNAKTQDDFAGAEQNLRDAVASHPMLQRWAPHIPDVITPQWINDALAGQTTAQQLKDQQTMLKEYNWDQDHVDASNKMFHDVQTSLRLAPDPAFDMKVGMGQAEFEQRRQLLEYMVRAKETMTQRQFQNWMAQQRLDFMRDPGSFSSWGYGGGQGGGGYTPPAFPNQPGAQATAPPAPPLAQPPQVPSQAVPFAQAPPAQTGAPQAGPPQQPAQPPPAQPQAQDVPLPGSQGFNPQFPARGRGTYIPGVSDNMVAQFPSLQFIATQVPPQYRAQVYNYVSGESKMPPAGTRGFGQALRNAAIQADPSLGDNRYEMLRKFSFDPSLQAVNIALGHAGDLGQALYALHSGNVPLLQSLAKKLSLAVGDTPYSTFQTIVNKLGPELAKAYIASGGTAGERGTTEEDFDPAKRGLDQLAANLQVTVHLLRSKIDYQDYQWRQNAAPWMPFNRFITPHARDVLRTWDPGGGSEYAPPGQSGGTSGAPGGVTRYKTVNGQLVPE